MMAGTHTGAHISSITELHQPVLSDVNFAATRNIRYFHHFPSLVPRYFSIIHEKKQTNKQQKKTGKYTFASMMKAQN